MSTTLDMPHIGLRAVTLYEKNTRTVKGENVPPNLRSTLVRSSVGWDILKVDCEGYCIADAYATRELTPEDIEVFEALAQAFYSGVEP